MAISRRAIHGNLIGIWSLIALFSAASVGVSLFPLRDTLLTALFAYALLTAVSCIAGHLRILSGRPGGGVLIGTPCVPPLLLLLGVLFNGGRGIGVYFPLLPLAFVFLLLNVLVGWKAEQTIRTRQRR